ncbi:hypothetical protein VP01_2747g3 [Puccinia sorghi]|uniref:Uncharacterized protein n=1 Tax=Puccinia sorghi TaxID=27349 RepID=A0A0L6V4W0_9BASI|nr:hypothetical protein VP01_2747g3 [Puccinia sorghi]
MRNHKWHLNWLRVVETKILGFSCNHHQQPVAEYMLLLRYLNKFENIVEPPMTSSQTRGSTIKCHHPLSKLKIINLRVKGVFRKLIQATLEKKCAQPAVDIQKFQQSFWCYSNHSPRLIQPSFDAQSLGRLHSDCATTSTHANRWSLDGSLAGACCMSTAGKCLYLFYLSYLLYFSNLFFIIIIVCHYLPRPMLECERAFDMFFSLLMRHQRPPYMQIFHMLIVPLNYVPAKSGHSYFLTKIASPSPQKNMSLFLWYPVHMQDINPLGYWYNVSWHILLLLVIMFFFFFQGNRIGVKTWLLIKQIGMSTQQEKETSHELMIGGENVGLRSCGLLDDQQTSNIQNKKNLKRERERERDREREREKGR